MVLEHRHSLTHGAALQSRSYWLGRNGPAIFSEADGSKTTRRARSRAAPAIYAKDDPACGAYAASQLARRPNARRIVSGIKISLSFSRVKLILGSYLLPIFSFRRYSRYRARITARAIQRMTEKVGSSNKERVESALKMAPPLCWPFHAAAATGEERGHRLGARSDGPLAVGPSWANRGTFYGVALPLPAPV